MPHLQKTYLTNYVTLPHPGKSITLQFSKQSSHQAMSYQEYCTKFDQINTWTKFKGKTKTYQLIQSYDGKFPSDLPMNSIGVPHDTNIKQSLQKFKNNIELKVQKDVLMWTISQMSLLLHHDLVMLSEIHNLFICTIIVLMVTNRSFFVWYPHIYFVLDEWTRVP